MDAPTLSQLTTVGGITIAVTALVEVFWRTANLAPATKTRFGPASAAICGVILGVLAALLLGQGHLDVIQAGINGFFAGCAAMGVQNLVSAAVPSPAPATPPAPTTPPAP